MEAVREALAEHADTASAQEIGDRVGVSRVSARRYLEHLVARGPCAGGAQVRHHRPPGEPLPVDPVSGTH
jgi:response regulator of citrate/malate metabolism